MSRSACPRCPARRGHLPGPVLALPLKFAAADELVLVLELGAVARLVQRRQQEDVPRPLDETGIPYRCRELEAEERRNLFSRIAAPHLQLAARRPRGGQMPSFPRRSSATADVCPEPGIGAEPAPENPRQLVVLVARPANHVDGHLHEIGRICVAVDLDVGPTRRADRSVPARPAGRGSACRSHGSLLESRIRPFVSARDPGTPSGATPPARAPVPEAPATISGFDIERRAECAVLHMRNRRRRLFPFLQSMRQSGSVRAA